MKMKTMKYPINKEFLPLSLYTPSLNISTIARFNKIARPPKAMFKDPSLNVKTVKIPSYKDGEIELMLIEPVDIEHPAPCFFDIHGGGFVFEGTSSHYKHTANIRIHRSGIRACPSKSMTL